MIFKLEQNNITIACGREATASLRSGTIACYVQ